MAILSEILALLDKWPEWKRVREAPARLDALEKRMALLEQKAPVTAGRPCPACGQPAMRRTGVKPDPMFGDMGVKLETWTCASCGGTDEVQNSALTK